MARTTLWFAAALSAAPSAEAGLRGSHGVRTRRAESMLDPADGAEIATMPTPSTDTEELVLNPLKEPMWYSVEYEEGKRYCRYDAHYPGQLLQASMSGLLHKTREMCCYANPGACEDYPAVDDQEDFGFETTVDPTVVTMPTPGLGDVTLGTVATTTEETTTTEPAPLVPYWYPVDLSGHRTCVHDAEYDPAYLNTHATFLFESRDGCCTAFQACQTANPTSSPTGRPEKWFPHTFEDGTHKCAKGTFYPDAFAKEPFSETFLHDTEESCCEGFPSACRDDDTYRWIPNHTGDDCAYTELPPSMILENHAWIFTSREGCCASHPCVDVGSSVPATEETTTTEAPVMITDPTELTTEMAETTTMMATTEAPKVIVVTTEAVGAPCASVYEPVCGHDGLSYGSGCDAEAFGTGIACDLDHGLDIVAGSPCLCPETGPTGVDYVTTVPATEGPETVDPREEKSEFWYPRKDEEGNRYCRYDADYPEKFVTKTLEGEHGKLFETRDDCCAFYPDACPMTPMWYPTEDEAGKKSCQFDADYDPSFLSTTATLLFDSRDGCCEAFPVACVTSAPTAMPTTGEPTARPTDFPTVAATPATAGRWLANQEGDDCVYMDLPWGMANSDLAFETKDGCCEVNSCPTTEVPVVTVAPVTTTTTTTTTVSLRWVPDEDGSDCVERRMPETYLGSDWVYETRDACCADRPCGTAPATTVGSR